ncbi:high-affinity choline transporter 1 isoform X2 [Patella vulgata]|nr:high-affinity choline transporter 1 isoform X2 [Patella vulgata]
MEAKDSGVWIDLLIAMSFGTIPWQAYFQRVLSVRSGKQAQILSITGAFGALILVLPSIFIGAVATSANWNSTSLGNSPMVLNKSSDVLPYVLQEFTPPVISLLGLGAISAAVMSSMDSAILGSSSMFTHNIYSNILRKQASQVELQIIQRLAIICLGSLATVISLSVPILYGLFILAADVVFVIVLPQLTCAIFLQRTNTYGAIGGFLAGFILRVGAGEPNFQLPAFIFYPKYDPELGQLFPFRTFAMVCSFVTIVIVSELVQLIKRKSVCSCSSSSNTEYNYNIVDESKSRKCCHVKSDDLEELTSL